LERERQEFQRPPGRTKSETNWGEESKNYCQAPRTEDYARLLIKKKIDGKIGGQRKCGGREKKGNRPVRRLRGQLAACKPSSGGGFSRKAPGGLQKIRPGRGEPYRSECQEMPRRKLEERRIGEKNEKTKQNWGERDEYSSV